MIITVFGGVVRWRSFPFFKNMVLAVVLTAAGAMSANAAIVSNSDTQSFEPFGFMVSSQTAPSAAFPDT